MSTNTFLPEDYLALKAERRTNFICLALFVIVMLGVVGAFLVTNRQWTMVRERQETINIRYQQAALEIEELNQLREQKDAMLYKANLAAALVERVPRSILLAELINRMPPQLGLLELELTSKQVKSRPAVSKADNKRGKKGSLKAKRGRTREEAVDDLQKIEPPRYDVTVVMVGVAPTDLEVSRYMAELNNYDLLQEVALEYSEEKEVNGRAMREFRILMQLNRDADVRYIEPKVAPRELRDPLNDQMQFGTDEHTVSVPDHTPED